MDTRIKPIHALWNLLFSKLPYNAVRFISSGFREKLIEVIKGFKPELIILENLYPAAYLDDIRNNSNAKIVFRAHNIEHEIWERTALNANGLRKLYINILAKRIKNFEYSLINQYDILVPITQRDGESLRGMGNNKPCFILPTGYYMKAKEVPELEIQTPVVAHLGALDWLPNQEGLLWFIDKVWPRLREIHPDVEFHIAGRNAPKWFEKKFHLDGVTFHGEIEDADHFLRSYPIHIVPLFSGSGMRIKIVEAMAYGRAVVTTTIGTEGIDTQDGANILISDSDLSFANSIIKLIENEAYCREIGKNAFTFVNEKLNNDKLVAELLEFVGKTL